tara:strand:+ start:8 stop:511 length:504 start_codon:yes stop_codon:yes gene_type:complete
MSIHKIDGGPGGETNHFPKKFVTLYSSDTSITAGDFVMIDPQDTTNGLGASVRQAESGYNTNIHEGLCLGISTQTITAAGNIVVQIAGKYENANVAATVVCGQNLVMSTTVGRAQDATQLACQTNFDALERNIIAVALESEGAATGTEAFSGGTNLADVMIKNQGFF